MISPSPSESSDGFSLGSAKSTEQIHARQIVFSYQACTTCFRLHISMAPETVELSPVELSPVELTPVELTTWEGPPVILSEGEAALEFWAIIGSSIAPECLGDSFHKTSAQIGATIYHQPQQGTSTGALRPGMEVWLYKARGGFVYIQELQGTGWLKAFHVQGLSMPLYAPQLPWYGSGMYRPDRYGSDVDFFFTKMAGLDIWSNETTQEYWDEGGAYFCLSFSESPWIPLNAVGRPLDHQSHWCMTHTHVHQTINRSMHATLAYVEGITLAQRARTTKKLQRRLQACLDLLQKVSCDDLDALKRLMWTPRTCSVPAPENVVFGQELRFAEMRERGFPFLDLLQKGVLRRYKRARIHSGGKRSAADHYVKTINRDLQFRKHCNHIAAEIVKLSAHHKHQKAWNYMKFVADHKNFFPDVRFDFIMSSLTDCFHSECLAELLESKQNDFADDTCPTDAEDEEDKCVKAALVPKHRRPSNERSIRILPRDEWHVTFDSVFLVKRCLQLESVWSSR